MPCGFSPDCPILSHLSQRRENFFFSFLFFFFLNAGFSFLDSECLSQHGVCQQDNLGCSGFYKSGLCDGPVNRRCCIPNSFPGKYRVDDLTVN